MSWADHTPDCWTTVPPDNSHGTHGANAGWRWLLPPHNGRYQPAPVLAALNFDTCCGLDYWSCDEHFPEELQTRGIDFPKGEHLAAAGYLFGPKLLGPAETVEYARLKAVL